MAMAQRQIRISSQPDRLFARLANALEAALECEAESVGLWLPVAVGAGIAAWLWLPGKSAWIGWIAVMLGLATLGLLTGARQRRLPRALSIAALALALGCALIWWRSERVAAPVPERPVVASFAGRVERVEPQPAQGRVRLIIRPAAGSGLPPRVRVNLPTDERFGGQVAAGDAIALRARLMPPPAPALPGGYDYRMRAWFDGIGAVGSAIGPARIERSGTTEGGVQARLAAHIRSRLPGSAGGIAAALAAGERGGIRPEDEDAMRASGLSHLLSISGLHVTAVVGAVMWLALALLALSPRLALRWPLMTIAAGCGAGAAVAYTLLTGAEVPTVRSMLAALLVLLAMAMGREPLTLRLVAAAALIVMLLWPESIAGPSFQMSFAAVAAIVALHQHPRVRSWFHRREEPWSSRLLRTMANLLLTGLVVEATLMPIALFHFHQAGVYGALANVIAIPLTTFVIMPAEALALLLDIAGLGAPAWWVTGQAINGLLGLAHMVQAMPGSVTLTPAMAPGAFALAAIGLLWMMLWQRRWRWAGTVPLALSALMVATTSPPDVVISSDGRHVAVRDGSGRYATLRASAGDYVRDQLAEATGEEGGFVRLDDLASAQCNDDFCRWTMMSGDRQWSLLAARSMYQADWETLIAACAAADIVIAPRRLPQACQAKWLTVDRRMLDRTGGIAIDLSHRTVHTVADSARGKPWTAPRTLMPQR